MFQTFREKKVDKIGKGNGNDNTMALSIVICVGRVMVDQTDLNLTMAMLITLKMAMTMTMTMPTGMATAMPKVMLIRMSRFQFAATRGFTGARVVLKNKVQKASQFCLLSFTRLMAHIGTVPTEKDWLSFARFAPIQIAKPGLVALGKCAVSIDISAEHLTPRNA